jgi:hypothetical protein
MFELIIVQPQDLQIGELADLRRQFVQIVIGKV